MKLQFATVELTWIFAETSIQVDSFKLPGKVECNICLTHEKLTARTVSFERLFDSGRGIRIRFATGGLPACMTKNRKFARLSTSTGDYKI